MGLEVNVQVYCKLQGLWARGRVVAVEPECLVKLQDGRLISPSDLQSCSHILRVPRYPVGAYVHCKMDSRRWAAGRVVSHSFEEPGHPSSEVYPYQVKLKQGGLLIYVLEDNDALITDRQRASPCSPANVCDQQCPQWWAEPGNDGQGHGIPCTLGLASLAFEIDLDEDVQVPDHEMSPRNAQTSALHLGLTESEVFRRRGKASVQPSHKVMRVSRYARRRCMFVAAADSCRQGLSEDFACHKRTANLLPRLTIACGRCLCRASGRKASAERGFGVESKVGFDKHHHLSFCSMRAHGVERGGQRLIICVGQLAGCSETGDLAMQKPQSEQTNSSFASGQLPESAQEGANSKNIATTIRLSMSGGLSKSWRKCLDECFVPKPDRASKKMGNLSGPSSCCTFSLIFGEDKDRVCSQAE